MLGLGFAVSRYFRDSDFRRPQAPRKRNRGAARRALKKQEAQRKKEEKTAEEKADFDRMFPDGGRDRFTAMGKRIGSPGMPLMEFIPSVLHGNKRFKFRAILDHIDPLPRSCDRPIAHRHYRVEWEPKPKAHPNEPDPVPEITWTHCANFKDHIDSDMQSFYDSVIRQKIDAYKQELVKRRQQLEALREKVQLLETTNTVLAAENNGLRTQNGIMSDELLNAREDRDMFRDQRDRARAECDDLRKQLEESKASAAVESTALKEALAKAQADGEAAMEGAEDGLEEHFRVDQGGSAEGGAQSEDEDGLGGQKKLRIVDEEEESGERPPTSLSMSAFEEYDDSSRPSSSASVDSVQWASKFAFLESFNFERKKRNWAGKQYDNLRNRKSNASITEDRFRELFVEELKKYVPREQLI